MGLPRAIEGALNTGLQITWTQDDGTALNLTGATITGTIEDKDGGTSAIAGVLAIVTATSGIFSWTYAAGDVTGAVSVGVAVIVGVAATGEAARLGVTDGITTVGLGRSVAVAVG